MTTPTTMEWIRTAATRISRGSTRLATLLTRRAVHAGTTRAAGVRGWLAGATGLSWALRVALLLLGALILRRLLASVAGGLVHRIETSRTLLWLAVTAWVIAAYRVGAEDWKPRTRPAAEPDEQVTVERDDEANTPAGSEQLEPAAEAPPLPTYDELCKALATVGTPHAHIAALAEHLGAAPERVREALDRHGVSVEPVRMRGRGSSTGIKGDALPPPTPCPVVAAGQPANNDNNNALRIEHGQGMTIVHDPADTHRHHTVGH